MSVAIPLRRVAGGTSLHPSTRALLARMTSYPTAARVALYDTFYREASAILAKLDCLYLLAAHDAQAARLNLVQNAYNLTAINSPTFTVDSGYTGNGTSAYLSTGVTASTLNASGKMKQNSLTIGSFVLTEVNSLQAVVGSASTGSNALFLIPNYATNVVRGAAYSAGNSYIFPSPVSTIEQYSIARNDSSTFIIRRAGANVLSSSLTSQTPGSESIDVLRAVATYFPGEVGASFFGAYLTEAEETTLRNAIRSYLVSIGRLT